jgi:hypothetical protein
MNDETTSLGVCNSTPTPRTDAFGSAFVKPATTATMLIDEWAGFARTLERELASALESVARLESDVKAYRENVKEMQREHREALRDAVAEARREAATGDPYGTY